MKSEPHLSDWALLADFLMLWLKRCAVPTLPHEVIVADVVYPAVLLAREVNLPSPVDGSWDSERVAGTDQKPVPSGGHCRLPVWWGKLKIEK